MYDDSFLRNKLLQREQQNALRTLKLPEGNVDFSSNDYLGIVKNNLLHDKIAVGLKTGSTGSRLLSGNNALVEKTEKQIAQFHDAEAALIFNSGYDANVGLLSCIPQKNDTVFYDQLCHASIRDGIRLSFAQSFSFPHNNIHELEKKMKAATGNRFVVTESVFSMDGDLCPLAALVSVCKKYNAHLVIDEAHATGIVGENGEGLTQNTGLHREVFCRIHTFGKACGCHGAAVVGSTQLRDYLINFARSFVYTTALPEHSVAAISASYHTFPSLNNERSKLKMLIERFQQARLSFEKLVSSTPIQVVIIPGNGAVKTVAEKLQHEGLDVRPILYPTVPAGKERLRIVLHAFNTTAELEKLIELLS